MRRFATIIRRDIGAKGYSRMTGQAYPPVLKPFYLDEDGGMWAVPREHERSALSRVGECVEIEIRCLDDQFAYPVSSH